MKTRVIAIVVAALAICVALTGCGSGGSTSTAAAGGGAAGGAVQNDQGINKGRWELVSKETDGEMVWSEKELEIIRSLGYDICAFASDEGDFYLEFTIHTYYHKFDKKDVSSFTGGTINFRDQFGSGSFDADVQLEGDILTIELDGNVYTFERDAGDGVDLKLAQYTQDNYIHGQWMVNGNAILELSGEELLWLLWCEDYVKSDYSNREVRNEAFGTAELGAFGPGSNFLTEDELKALSAGGQGSPVVFMLKCSDFGTEVQSAEEIYEACFNKPVPKLASGDGLYVSVTSDSSGNDYLVLMNPDSQWVMISGASGLSVLSEILGDDLGSSVSEAYTNIAEFWSAG